MLLTRRRAVYVSLGARGLLILVDVLRTGAGVCLKATNAKP